jgi:hypothetical protein
MWRSHSSSTSILLAYALHQRQRKRRLAWTGKAGMKDVKLAAMASALISISSGGMAHQNYHRKMAS